MRTFVLLQLLVLARAAPPSLTGNPGVLDEERSSQIAGALQQSLRGTNKRSELPTVRGRNLKLHGAAGNSNRKLQPGKSKGKAGGNVLPSYEEIPLIDQDLYSYGDDDDCKLVTFNETFLIYAADHPGDDTVGSQYIFDQPIYQVDGSEVPNVIVAGVCTRTRSPDAAGLYGGGSCQLNFVETTGNYTLSTQGYLSADPMPELETAGSLVVTGGSGSMISVLGEMNIVPMNFDGLLVTTDVFIDAYAYKFEAALGLIVCPNPYHLSEYGY